MPPAPSGRDFALSGFRIAICGSLSRRPYTKKWGCHSELKATQIDYVGTIKRSAQVARYTLTFEGLRVENFQPRCNISSEQVVRLAGKTEALHRIL